MQDICINLVPHSCVPLMKIDNWTLISRECFFQKHMKVSFIWECKCNCGYQTFIFESNLIYNLNLLCCKCSPIEWSVGKKATKRSTKKIAEKKKKKRLITRIGKRSKMYFVNDKHPDIKYKFTPEQVARATSMHSHQNDPLICKSKII